MRRPSTAVCCELLLGLSLCSGWAAASPAAAEEPARRPPRPRGEGVVTVSDLTFQGRVLTSSVPVLVDFWAPWCLPCRELDEPLAAAAAKLGDRVRIVRVNVRWNSRYVHRYGIQVLPTMVLFVGGREVERSTGFLSSGEIEELLGQALPAPPPAAAVPAGTVAALAMPRP